MNKQKIILLIVIVVIAAFSRLWLIDRVPGGLYPDEAANGLDINLIFEGKLQPFYERGNGREALFFYMLAASVALLGRTPFAHHVVSALIGVTVVLLTYLLVKRWFNTRLALVAAYLTAVSSWYITLSRTAFRANAVPLFVLLFFYFATRVIQSRSRIDYFRSAILAGIAFGLGFYTYIAYRMMIPLLLIVAAWLFIVNICSRPRLGLVRKYMSGIVLGIISTVIVLLPLISYFASHPEWISGRSGQVSIFSPSLNHGNVLGTFMTVVLKTARGFFFMGDMNWRHNVAGWPFLSPISGGLFIAGLIFCITQALRLQLKRLPYLLLGLWFGLMLVPEILTAEGIPHGLRLIGVIPAVFIIVALFAEKVWQRRFLMRYFLGGWLLFEGLYGPGLYFGVAAQSPGYAQAFRADLTVISDYLNKRQNKVKTYLVLDLFSEQTVQYMTTEAQQPYQIIDPSTLWENLDLALKAGDQVIFPQSTIYDAQALEKNFPVQLVREDKNKWGEVVMRVYEQKGQ